MSRIARIFINPILEFLESNVLRIESLCVPGIIRPGKGI